MITNRLAEALSLFVAETQRAILAVKDLGPGADITALMEASAELDDAIQQEPVEQ